MNKDSLGDRMKGLYEDAYRIALPGRMPVVLRIDGRAFHSYTKDCEKPFDKNLISLMNDTAIYLCENIQGAELAYIQSDEISILLNNFKTLETQSWFNNNLQKMVSISSALASSYFTANSYKIFRGVILNRFGDDTSDYIKLATFDSRAFVLPKEEVANYFLWRQQDMTRNSVQMVARSLFSHKDCENKNNPELQEMIFSKGQNWNDFPTSQKRGRCAIKKTYMKDEVERSKWEIDNEIPIFSQKREYIENFIMGE